MKKTIAIGIIAFLLASFTASAEEVTLGSILAKARRLNETKKEVDVVLLTRDVQTVQNSTDEKTKMGFRAVLTIIEPLITKGELKAPPLHLGPMGRYASGTMVKDGEFEILPFGWMYRHNLETSKILLAKERDWYAWQCALRKLRERCGGVKFDLKR